MTDARAEGDERWREFFYGGLSPGASFEIRMMGLAELVESHAGEQMPPVSVPEVAFIALMACFEAFCKDNFAAVLNLAPQLVRGLETHGREVNISAVDLLEYDLGSGLRNLGFILAEKYAFSTASEINGLYTALLRFTPFSASDKQRHDQLRADRNLLVHHGGVLNRRYEKEGLQMPAAFRGRRHYDYIAITPERYAERSRFINDMATKIVSGTTPALEHALKNDGIQLSAEAAEALPRLGEWL